MHAVPAVAVALSALCAAGVSVRHPASLIVPNRRGFAYVARYGSASIDGQGFRSHARGGISLGNQRVIDSQFHH